MKRFLFLGLTAFTFNLSAQQKAPTDSAQYYQRELFTLWRQGYDSLVRSEKAVALRNNYMRIIAGREDYTAFVLFADALHSDYRAFNGLLQQDGFPPLSPLSFRAGFGVSNKRGSAVYDFYLLTVGFNNKTSKGNESVRTSLSNALQLDFGLDLLNKERVSLYPFGGFSLRLSDISYNKPGSANPAYTGLADMYTDNNSSLVSSGRLGYQYGAGLDFSFGYNRYRTYKTIFFVKAGVNRPFGQDVYKADGIPGYHAGIRQGDWLLTAGFKFANKR